MKMKMLAAAPLAVAMVLSAPLSADAATVKRISQAKCEYSALGLRVDASRFTVRPGSTDHLYIDVQEAWNLPVVSVKLNGRAAKWRWRKPPVKNYPNEPKRASDKDPNLVSMLVLRPIVEVNWLDRRVGRKQQNITCRFYVGK